MRTFKSHGGARLKSLRYPNGGLILEKTRAYSNILRSCHKCICIEHTIIVFKERIHVTSQVRVIRNFGETRRVYGTIQLHYELLRKIKIDCSDIKGISSSELGLNLLSLSIFYGFTFTNGKRFGSFII